MLKSNFEVPVIMSIVLFLALTSMCLPALALEFRCEYASISLADGVANTYKPTSFEGRACKFQCPEISTRYDECMLKKGKGTPKHLMGILDRTCRRDACQPLG